MLISEGAVFEGGDMVFAKAEKDEFGHMKLGGIGDQVAEQLTVYSKKFNMKAS